MRALLRSRSFILWQYFHYWLNAIDEYSLQAPFIFQFYKQVIKDKTKFYAFDQIEQIRMQLLKDRRKIHVHDLGAGSLVNHAFSRKVSSIAAHSLSSARFSQFLFKVILYKQPRVVVELGTSIGINTLYLAKANAKTPVITLEGCPQTAAIARENFEKFQVENIYLKTGNIDTTLPELLTEVKDLDLVFFDANHTKEATLRYFKLCLNCVNDRTVFIFDDIHLSSGMAEAWATICKHPEITLSIDIFDAGLVFFEKGLHKSHYILNF